MLRIKPVDESTYKETEVTYKATEDMNRVVLTRCVARLTHLMSCRQALEDAMQCVPLPPLPLVPTHFILTVSSSIPVLALHYAYHVGAVEDTGFG